MKQSEATQSAVSQSPVSSNRFFERIVEGRVFKEATPEKGGKAAPPRKPRLVGPAGFSLD